MKKNMFFKSVLALVVSLFSLNASAFSLIGSDKPIEISQLPKAAQTVISTYFADRKVAMAKMDDGWFDRDYDVIFTTGEKIEFDADGNWTDVNCRRSAVPVKLIPAQIVNFVKNKFGDATIISIERDKKSYEVKLKTGHEITFNKKFQVTDIDD